jgi:uncharacterized membrane protein
VLLGYFLNDFEVFPVPRVIIGIISFFTFHMPYIYIVRFLYFKLFSAFFIQCLSPEIAKPIKKHVTLFQNCAK